MLRILRPDAEDRRDGDTKMTERETSWSTWYRDVRAEMEFRYGMKGISKDMGTIYLTPLIF